MSFFFVHDQGLALRRLFEANLRIHVNNNDVDLIVKFGVEKFRPGMLTPREKVAKVIRKAVKPNKPQILILSHIVGNSELNDMTFSLCNQGCLQLLCSELSASQYFLDNIQALHLDSNEISSLKPFRALKSSKLCELNLQFNKVESIEEFRFLDHLQIQKLFIVQNPVTRLPHFTERIFKLLPSLKQIDGTSLEHLPAPRASTSINFDNRSDEIKKFNVIFTKILQNDVDDRLKNEFSM